MVTALELARRHRRERGAAILAEFAELLAIPNVASDPAGLQANAVWIRDAFMKRGVRAATVALPGAAGAVIGRIDGRPGGPRLGFYAHYDGQPAADLSRWSSPPFTPTLRSGDDVVPWPEAGAPVNEEWRVYARGSADDRGAVLALLAALDALEGHDPEATMVFLVEGEEEKGSPHLPDYLDTLADRLAADLWLVCDGPVHPSGRAQVVLGARGIAEVEIEVFGPPADLHSGHYGSWAPNPAWLLADLVASLRDEFGRVQAPGLRTPEVDAETRRVAASLPDPGDRGFAPPPEGPRYSERVLESLVNVRGLRSGDVGESARNVVPASAAASLDLRLVAGQDPEAMIGAIRDLAVARGFVLVDGEPDAETRRRHRRIARIEASVGYPGFRTAVDHPAVRRVVEVAGAAAGEEPLVVPSMGSSVPLHHIGTRLGVPVAVLPIANADNNQHAPDENLRVGNLWYGIDVMAALLG